MNTNKAEVLLVEDQPAAVRLVQEVLKENNGNHNLYVAKDGVEAMAFLHREGDFALAPRPDLILLDLSLPKKDGREVLAKIKSDDRLKRIPVVILTVSESEEDILKTYDLQANCYIIKPIHLERFIQVIKSIENFWLNIVKLPPPQTP
jgi:chemotaxis family two-component system response regulator Rcp1